VHFMTVGMEGTVAPGGKIAVIGGDANSCVVDGEMSVYRWHGIRICLWGRSQGMNIHRSISFLAPLCQRKFYHVLFFSGE